MLWGPTVMTDCFKAAGSMEALDAYFTAGPHAERDWQAAVRAYYT